MKKLIACTAMSVLLLTGCTLGNHNGIIKVNDKVITQAQFDRAIDKEFDKSFLKNFGGSKNVVKSDDNVMYLIYKEKVSKELIVKSLLEQEIAKRNIKVKDSDIKAEMKIIIDKVGSKEQLNEILKQRGISNSDFTEDLKTQVKIKKLVNSIAHISVSDADAQKYYNENVEQFKTPDQVRASHILISANAHELGRTYKTQNKNITPPELNAKIDEQIKAQREKAEAILKEVQANPGNFSEIASKSSDDKVSAERGGDLGYFAKEAMVPEFSKAAFSMKPDTVSGIVQTPYGFHIIKVTDRVAAGTMPFAKVKEDIKFYLETQEQLKVLKNLTDGLMKTAKIEYIDPSFDSNNIAKKLKKEK